MTRCHVALGGCLLVLGRACGAVVVHAAPLDRGDSPVGRTIRQLDSGLDLASSGGGGDAGREGGGYELVAELVGVHASPITSIATDANCALLAIGDARGVVTLVDLAAGLMMTSVRVFSRDGEGVGCMEPCPRIVGTGTGTGSGSGGGGDAEVAGSNPDGDDDAAGDDGDAAGDASPPASRFPAPKFVRRQHRVRRRVPRRRAGHVLRHGFIGRGWYRTRPTHAEDPIRGARGGAADDERDSAAFDHGLWARSRRSPSRVDDGVVAVVQLTLVSGVDDGGRSTGAGADEFDDGGR